MKEKSTNILYTILILVLSAGLLYFMTEVGALENTFWYLVSPLSWIPKWVLVNGFTYLSLICGLSIIFPRYSISILVMTFLCGAMAVINHYMYRMHGGLFTLVDIYNVRTAMNVIGSYQFRFDKYIAMILVIMAILLGICVHLFRNREQDRTHTAGCMILNVLLCAVPAWYIYFGPVTILQGSDWHMQRTYAQYGWLPVMLDNAKNGLNKALEPEGYDAEKLAGMTVDNTGAASPAEYPDILIILNESWYFLDDFTAIHSDTDYRAVYDGLENAVRGHAVEPEFAGGTNSSEYVFLTSNSLSLLSATTPFYAFDLNGAHSIVDYLEDLGYETMAGHPALSTNYNRQTGWEKLGFDHLLFEGDFKPLETYHGFCRDDYAMEVFLDRMNGMDEDKPHLGFLLTIQNHGEWSNMSDEELAITVHPDREYSADVLHRIREFTSCMYETDQAIGYLTERLTKEYEETGRKVIVCMVGDHAPALVQDLQTDLAGTDKTIVQQATPYFIWANWPVDTDAARNTDLVDLCDLVPLVLKTAGMPLSVYYSHMVDLVDAGVSAHTDIVSGRGNTDAGIGTVYIDQNRNVHSVSEGGALAEMVQKYYWMEYSSLILDRQLSEYYYAKK